MSHDVLECPSCHQKVSIENLPGGNPSKCPACGHVIRSISQLPGETNVVAATREGPEGEVLDVLPADAAVEPAGISTARPIHESARRPYARRHLESKPQLNCPNCSGPIRADDQECPQCRKSLESSVLFEEEQQLTKHFARLRLLMWVFGLPGVVFMFATSFLFAEFKLGHLHQVVWPILTLVASFVFISIGVGFEAATRPIMRGKQLLVYGVKGFVIRSLFTADKWDKLARIRALLHCRKEARGQRRV